MNAGTDAVHKQTYLIHSYEVDLRGRARPNLLLCFMLDTAWSHVKDSDFSFNMLREEGQLWVLSRFLAVFHKMPTWNDEILVETWGKGTDNLFGLRDFIMYSQTGEKLVSATSAWLIIDRKTSRIQRIDKLNRNFPLQQERHEIDVKLQKIESQPAEQTGFEYIVRYTDLDVNKHVNSSKYMQWILDSFPIDFLDAKTLKSFEINFLAEAQLNDKIFVSTAFDDDHYYCEIKRERDNAELCRAKVVWE